MDELAGLDATEEAELVEAAIRLASQLEVAPPWAHRRPPVHG